MSSFPGPQTPGEANTTDEAIEASLDKRSNDFNELSVRQLETQWKHKVSVVPESVGITTRWWEYTAGVTRTGPSAEVSAGEHIYTRKVGEYNVGDPALAGAGVRFGSTLPQDGAGDDWWTGYTNRLSPNVTDAEGAGIGVKYFQAGEGDEGGAKEAGPQEYVWFRSSVSGVPDTVVPKDRWNGSQPDLDFFRDGGFVRCPFLFYDEGYIGINWGLKTRYGTDSRRLHTFTVEESPMWNLSDMPIQMGTSGANVTGYIDAAHFKAGAINRTIRENFEGRDGSVMGSSVSISQGTPTPLISIQLRDGWESLNIRPLSLRVSCDDSYYVGISVGGSLDSNADFSPPKSDVTDISPAADSYGVLSDNDATGFDSAQVGETGYGTFVEGSGGFEESTLQGEIEEVGLTGDRIATLYIIPIGATAFNGASIRWGVNF